MIKFLKRVLFFIVISFLLLNTAAFLVLNSPIIQHAVLNYININYLKSQHLKLKLSSLSVDFFSAAINLNEVSIENLDTNNQFGKKFNLSLNQISVGFNVPMSYFKRRPIIRKVLLKGFDVHLEYDSEGRILLPDFLVSQNKPSSENLTPLVIIHDLVSDFPFEVNILNSSIVLGREAEKGNYQNINIKSVQIKKSYINGNLNLDLNLNLNQSLLEFPFSRDKIVLNKFQTTGNLSENGKLNLDNLNIDSNVANINSNLIFNFKDILNQSDYISNIKDSTFFASDLFPFFGLSANGKLFFHGEIHSDNNLNLLPKANGHVSWDKLFISGISVYNGKANINLKDKTIFYNSAEIIPVNGTVLKSQGKFELFNEFNFYTDVNISQFPFDNLLVGFGVNDSPGDFLIDAQNLSVNGKIRSKNLKKGFEIYAKGFVNGTSLKLKKLSQVGNQKLPNFNFDLNLETNNEGLFFRNNIIYIPNNKITNKTNIPDKIEVKSGIISFSNKVNNPVIFELKSENIDLKNLQYFFKSPIYGQTEFSGVIKTTNTSPSPIFSCSAKTVQGELFNIRFKQMIGDISLNSDSIKYENGIVNIDNSKQKQTNFKFDKLKYVFSNSKIETQGHVSGDIHSFMNSNDYIHSPILSQASGKINALNFDLKGNFFNLRTWNLGVNADLDNINFMNGGIKNIKLKLNCLSGLCTNSSFRMSSIYENPKTESSSIFVNPKLLLDPDFKLKENKKAKIEYGQLFTQITQISLDFGEFKTQIYHFPLRFLDVDDSYHVSGFLSSRISFKGNWKSIQGIGKSQIIGLKIGTLNIGDLQLNMLENVNDQTHFQVLAFNNQMRSDFLLTPQDHRDSSIEVALERFDFTNLLDDKTKIENSLYSQFSGKLIVHGQLNSDSLFEPKKSFSKWKGSGAVSSGDFQMGQLLLRLNKLVNLTFANNQIRLDDIQMNSNFLNVHSSGSVNIFDRSINFPTDISMNLNYLKDLYPYLIDSSTVGEMNGTILASGQLDDVLLDGTMTISAKNIGLKNYTPDINNVFGQINFKQKTINIQKISGKKGNGEVTIAGNIDLSGSKPDVNLRLNASKADFKAQVPIFLFADVNLNADLLLTGVQKPYTITGEVNLLKFRIIRDIPCEQITTQIMEMPKNESSLSDNYFANLDFNISAADSIHVQTQCIDGKFSTEPFINITGNDVHPYLNGILVTDSAKFHFLKSYFDVKKARFQFLESQKYDPNVDIQLQAKISSYSVYWKMNGRFSQAKLDLSADPASLPNGDQIQDADISYMISSGQVPPRSSSANILSAYSVSSFIGFNNTLNDTAHAITLGAIDDFSISPSAESGQVSWRVNASKSLTQKFNLGVTYEDGSAGSTFSAYVNYLFNNTASYFGSFNSASYIQQVPIREIYNGLRFQFGSQQ